MLLAPVHATPQEFKASPYSTDEDGVDEKLLARASRVVDELTAGVPYRTDSDGHPVDGAVRDVLREATCAQAAYLDETGDPGGVVDNLGGVAIGAVRLGGGRNGGGDNSTTSRYAPEAVALLRASGMLTRTVLH